jgi:hypothetical protein
MLNVVAMAGMALSLLAAPAPMELTSAPTEKVTVEVQTVNGSGCPAGSATVRARADNTAFVVSYNDFLAYAGGGANLVESRKNCQINVRVHVPQGFTYAIAQAEYRGFAHLAAGATAQQIAHYYFSGQSATADSAHSFAGPLTTLWKTVDRADGAALVYAPCGADANLNINTELRVDAGSSKADAVSIVGMDSTRGSVETLFNLSWKKC